MKVFEIEALQNTLVFIPRYYPSSDITLNIKKEGHSDFFEEILSIGDYVLSDGYISITIDDFNFTNILSNDSKYRIKITDSEGVIYRGKAICTDQEAEDYKLTKDLYVYE